jgi:hypothetical protein
MIELKKERNHDLKEREKLLLGLKDNTLKFFLKKDFEKSLFFVYLIDFCQKKKHLLEKS